MVMRLVIEKEVLLFEVIFDIIKGMFLNIRYFNLFFVISIYFLMRD